MNEKFKTDHAGVFYRLIENGKNKQFYIQFKSDGKFIEQKIGKASEGMNPDIAKVMRLKLMKGEMPLAKELKVQRHEQRQAELIEKESKRWTMNKIFKQYWTRERKPGRSLNNDIAMYRKHIRPTMGKKLPSELTKERN